VAATDYGDSVAGPCSARMPSAARSRISPRS